MKTRKGFLYFRKQNCFIFQKTSYISGSNFPKKMKKKHSEKLSYTSGNGTL